MPTKCDNPGKFDYAWQLTDEEEESAKHVDRPNRWEYGTTVSSGFVMFDTTHPSQKGVSTNFREAAIGPIDDGETRVYVASERSDGSYVTEERYEGSFTEAMSRLRGWLREY